MIVAVAISARRTPIRLIANPNTSPETPEKNENVATTSAAVEAPMPRSMDRINEESVDVEQPERWRTQRLRPGESRLRQSARCTILPSHERFAWPTVDFETKILRPPPDQEPDRQQPDDQNRRADRQPSRPPAGLFDRKLRQQRQADETDHQGDVRDRRRNRAVAQEPVVDRAIDSKIVGAGKAHPGNAIGNIEIEDGGRERERSNGKAGGQHGKRQHQAGAMAIEQRPEHRREHSCEDSGQ
jgi:hypothetical protein